MRRLSLSSKPGTGGAPFPRGAYPPAFPRREDLVHAPRSPFWTGEFAASSCAAVALTLAPARGQQCTPDPLEPNDDCATAVTLPLGLHTGLTVPDGGADVLRVTVPAGQRLVATVSGVLPSLVPRFRARSAGTAHERSPAGFVRLSAGERRKIRFR